MITIKESSLRGSRALPVAAGAILIAAWIPHAYSQDATSGAVQLDAINVVTERDNRVSSGATKLPLEIKETPQTISVIDQETMDDYAATGSNEALLLGTGINIDQYETNRATFNARGFEVQLTQVDGLGMTNSFGTVVGEEDTFMFDKIELIRGANGLLTGVGNASGTINYVRKRPVNEDTGQIELSGGSWDFLRAAADYNKVLTEDGSWAGRIVVAHEDKDSHLRALHDTRTTVYGVVDGQVGENGVVTLGLTLRDADQDSPMWGSLTLNYPDGSQAEFDDSSSTSQDWTYWNTQSTNAFVEYLHYLGEDWEAKFTYNTRHTEEDTRLFYAYSPTGPINFDNTGLVGWPYSSHTETDSEVMDANVSGTFDAWGLEHSLIAGVSVSEEDVDTSEFSYDTSIYQFLPLPAFPYAGDVYPQPVWNPAEPTRKGVQELSRLYVASRIGITEKMHAIAGLNAFRLEREGSSRYGNIVEQDEYPATEEESPYFGLTYDFTDNVTGYASYSDIFQNQDQTDYYGDYLDPMKGVNTEVGAKAEWLDGKLLTTLALFTAEQEGLATYEGLTPGGQYYYVPKDVESEGIEIEVIGRVSENTNIALGFTNLELRGPDGNAIYEWVPRTTISARVDTRLAAMPKLRMGIAGRWQSEVESDLDVKQDAFLLANAFATYDLSPNSSLRLNINNLFNEKYIGGLAYGAIYGAPINGLITYEYRFGN